MALTPEQQEGTASYMRDVFGSLGEPLDDQLEGLMERAVAAGLPRIAVSADVGRLLMVMAQLASGPGSVGRALEVGTLGGYSGLWIARGLPEGARLITIEAEPAHAAFARAEFDRSGLGGSVEIREGEGIHVMPRVVGEFGEGSFDLVFLDALKREYPGYGEHASRLLRSGGLLVADNCLGSDWWITDAPGSSENRDVVDGFNRWLGSSASGFMACCIANREGLVVARKT